MEWEPLLIQSDVPGLEYRLAPNFDNGKSRINADGLIWKPDSSKLSEKKVLVIGDSISFGGNVSLEQNFAVLLENQLREKLNIEIDIWNSGTPGYNTTQEAILLDDIGPEINPDLVIVQFCMNDYKLAPILNSKNVLEYREAGKSDKKSNFFLTTLVQSKALFFLKAKIIEIQKTHPEWFPKWLHYIRYVTKKKGWERAKESLVTIHEWTHKRDIALLLVIFPFEQQLRISDNTPQRDLASFAKLQGIHYLDLYDSFKLHCKDGLFIDYSVIHKTADKVHLNENGHILASQEIASTILRNYSYYLNMKKIK